jgi:hypothetical protein
MLNFENVELRRLRFDLTFYYKMFNDLSPFYPNVAFTVYILPPNLNRSSPTMQKPIRISTKPFSGIFYVNIDA